MEAKGTRDVPASGLQRVINAFGQNTSTNIAITRARFIMFGYAGITKRARRSDSPRFENLMICDTGCTRGT